MPTTSSPAAAGGGCPASAACHSTVVFPFCCAEEHNAAYLQEVLTYFVRERAEAYAAGAAPCPLGARPRGQGAVQSGMCAQAWQPRA